MNESDGRHSVDPERIRSQRSAESVSASAERHSSPLQAPRAGTPEPPTSHLRTFLHRAPRWTIYFAVAVAGTFVLLVAYRVYGFLTDFSNAVNILADEYGLNRWLAKAIALAFTSPLWWGFKHGFLRFWERRRLAQLGTCGYACLYFLAMYWVSKDVAFSHGGASAGQVRIWYAETPEGIRYFDSPGVDPKYGIGLTPETPAHRIEVERRRRGKGPKPIALRDLAGQALFDPLNRSPNFWYWRATDGHFEVFDADGFHPQSGQPLSPLTSQIAPELLDQIARVRALEDATTALLQVDARKSAVLAEEAGRKARSEQDALERRAYAQRYVDFDMGASSGVWAILVVGPDGQVEPRIAGAAASALRVRVAPLLRPAIVADGLFGRLYAGDADTIARLDLAAACDGIVLGKLSELSTSEPLQGGVLTRRLRLEARVIPLPSGAARTLSLDAKGGGFTAQEAGQQALERLSQELAERVAR